MKKKIAIVLAGLMIASMTSGCGLIKEKNTEKTNATTVQTTESTSATGTDAIIDKNEATPTDAGDDVTTEQVVSGKKASCGSNDGYVYTNKFADLEIDITETDWHFYSNEKVAAAAGMDTSKLEEYLSGEKSPYDTDITYCTIAYKDSTGSNIIVNYINPAYYNMSEALSGKEYLELGAAGYSDVKVEEGTIAGHKCASITLPKSENTTYTQTMYAYNQDGLIVIVTFTIMDDDTLDEAIGLVSSN